MPKFKKGEPQIGYSKEGEIDYSKEGAIKVGRNLLFRTKSAAVNLGAKIECHFQNGATKQCYENVRGHENP